MTSLRHGWTGRVGGQGISCSNRAIICDDRGRQVRYTEPSWREQDVKGKGLPLRKTPVSQNTGPSPCTPPLCGGGAVPWGLRAPPREYAMILFADGRLISQLFDAFIYVQCEWAHDSTPGSGHHRRLSKVVIIFSFCRLIIKIRLFRRFIADDLTLFHRFRIWLFPLYYTIHMTYMVALVNLVGKVVSNTLNTMVEYMVEHRILYPIPFEFIPYCRVHNSLSRLRLRYPT